MPANKNAVIRYKFLDELLSDRHHFYSMEEITDKVNDRLMDLGYPAVVKRSLEKDIVFLQERPFCAPIERFRAGGKNCVRYASRSYSIFNHELTKEEMSVLYEVLNTIGQFEGLPNFEWLEGLRSEMGLEKHKQVLYFSRNPLLKNSNILAALYEYVANEQVLSVTYKRFTDIESETYILHPYFLKQYNDRWYLVGLRPDTEQIYTLPIDRIQNLKALPEEKYLKPKDTIENHFVNTIGITVYDQAEPQEILFWASDMSSPYLETKPLHHSQTKRQNAMEDIRNEFNLPDGGHIFQLYCTLNLELQQELARHFDNIIILKPTELRSEVVDKIKKMHENYKNLIK